MPVRQGGEKWGKAKAEQKNHTNAQRHGLRNDIID